MLNNPMQMALNQSKMAQGMANVKKLMQTVKSVGNPQMFFTQMLSQNPQIKEAMDYINANGGDPRKVYYQAAAEKGVDPEQFLRDLMS